MIIHALVNADMIVSSMVTVPLSSAVNALPFVAKSVVTVGRYDVKLVPFSSTTTSSAVLEGKMKWLSPEPSIFDN